MGPFPPSFQPIGQNRTRGRPDRADFAASGQGRLIAVLGINHIAFRSPDPARLKAFYEELLGAEPLDGAHDPLRVGTILLVFFRAARPGAAGDPDELAFDVDAAGFDDVLERARRMGVLAREPVDHTPQSKGFLVRDPDGRRIELVYDDRGVYWRE
jgi:catechol 2,3-dioxygenase-like lactoylglutathione lyase family enzyme